MNFAWSAGPTRGAALRRLGCRALVLLLVSQLGSAADAFAQTPPPGPVDEATAVAPAPPAPFIGPNHEADALALLGPYRGSKPLADGWVVDSIGIPGREVVFSLKHPTGATARLRLVHPSAAADAAARTRHFAIVRDDPAGAAGAALDVLVTTIRDSDHVDIWQTPRPSPTREKPREGPRETPLQGAEHLARAGAISMHVPPLESPLQWVRAFLTDGILLVLVALVVVLAHLRRVLRAEEAWVWKTLAGLVAVGATVRLTLSVPTVMNAWPFTRIPPVVRAAMGGGVLRSVSGLFDVDVYTFDVTHTLDLAIALLTPIVFFAHARFVLKSARSALFAVAILVVLPMHVRFSASDIEYVQSLATSSLTFTVLYVALRDESRAWRTLAFALLPLLSLGTYLVRPENLFFAGVDLAALVLTVGPEVPRRRKLLAGGLVLATSSYAFVTHLLVRFGAQVDDGLSLSTLQKAAATFFVPRANTLLNPSITPPWLPVLVVLGAVWLVRQGLGRRALYLSGWLLGFFVVHATVTSPEPAMQARYHMHLITPSLLLGTSGLVLLWDRLPRVRPLFVVLLAASPLVHLSFIRDTNFTIMREYDFLQQQRDAIPEGCTVLEFIGADPSMAAFPYTDPILPRIAERLHRGELDLRWNTIPATYLPAPGEPGHPHMQLTNRAKEALASNDTCVVFYEGVVCATHAPNGLARHPLCDELAGRSRSVLAETSFPPRFYDSRSVPGDGRPRATPFPQLRVAFHTLSSPGEPPNAPPVSGQEP